jgi:hypothetical protein
MRKMTRLEIAAEVGKIWAKGVAVIAAGVGSLYGIAWLMFNTSIMTNELITHPVDMFFMVVFPAAALLYVIWFVITISWSEAKWRLEKKERGWK